jgi:2-polyprenyl-3-methyl-5-hydroxy-6-metoxy-1,4-benzoquinol methylase
VEIEELYDRVYKNCPDYNGDNTTEHGLKQHFIDDFVARDNGSVLDAGCGSGYTLRKLYNEGVDIIGIDFSQIACDTFLQGLPHKCVSIIDHCKMFPKYDSIVCSDVLEHIPFQDLYNNLIWLSNTSEHALFGIANHSDIKLGQELHLIQQPSHWWIETLSKFYYEVHQVTSMFDDRFFFIECYNH